MLSTAAEKNGLGMGSDSVYPPGGAAGAARSQSSVKVIRGGEIYIRINKRNRGKKRKEK